MLVDLLLAVGGGSCCDYAKAVSGSVHCEEDPWEKYYIRFEEPSCEIIPVGCVLTHSLNVRWWLVFMIFLIISVSSIFPAGMTIPVSTSVRL